MLAFLNTQIAMVRLNGKIRFVYFRDRQIAFYGRGDISTLLENLKVSRPNGEQMPAFEWWLQQEGRREFSRVMFEPDPVKAKKHPQALNLFRGFGVKSIAKERGCNLFYQHLLDNVCDGDVLNYQYLLDIFASWVQRPGVKVPAPVLVGGKGSGKSLVSEVMAHIIGEANCVTVNSTEQLTGRFNSALGKALLVKVEEATYANDLKSQATIKHLLTGGRLLIEFKGLEPIEVESKCNFIFTSNLNSVVNATGGERRYFCLQVANYQQQQAAYFNALIAQLENGGYQALMADLMARDITNTNFAKPPRTSLLSRQIVDSLTGLERWWCEALAAGELPFTRTHTYDEASVGWPAGGRWATEKSTLVASAGDFGRDYAGRPPSPEVVGKFLAGAVPGIVASRPRVGTSRVQVYDLPDLETCRAAFVAARPGLLLDDVREAVGLELSANDDNASKPKVKDAWALRNRRPNRLLATINNRAA